MTKHRAAKRAADARYDAKRAERLVHFGGRCTPEEKALLARLAEQHSLTIKELIFVAVRQLEEKAVNQNDGS